MKKKMNAKEIWSKYGKLQKEGCVELGPHSSYHLKNTPRRVLFSMSRYKFAAKLFGKEKSILELGCSDGVGTYILAEGAKQVMGVDFDKEVISWAQKNVVCENAEFICDNFLEKKYGSFDGIISYDVIEHIQKKNEKLFFKTICGNLVEDGILILGTPNITSKKYSSTIVNAGHINLYSHDRLKKTMERYFNNVFMFGMNDEVIHTGFLQMAQYLLVMGCYKK